MSVSISTYRIAEALHVRFRMVDGLNHFMIGEPKTIQRAPLMYTMYADYAPSQHGQVFTETHTYLHRVVYSFAEPEQAEKLLMIHITEIQETLEADPMLDGLLEAGGIRGGGGASIEKGQAGFIHVAELAYRIQDYNSRVVVKRPVQRGR